MNQQCHLYLQTACALLSLHRCNMGWNFICISSIYISLIIFSSFFLFIIFNCENIFLFYMQSQFITNPVKEICLPFLLLLHLHLLRPLLLLFCYQHLSLLNNLCCLLPLTFQLITICFNSSMRAFWIGFQPKLTN